VAGTATIAKSASIQNGEICADPVEQTAQLLAARNRRSGTPLPIPLLAQRDRTVTRAERALLFHGRPAARLTPSSW